MAMVSAVINTLNEASNIEFCLRSLYWCDEIIVVDMESDDDTIEIASQFTNKIYKHPKMGYVEPARKFAVEKASGDWILVMDADELISQNLKIQLFSIIVENEYDVIYIPRKNYIMGTWIKYAGWWPDYQLRLFKKGAVRFTDQIHAGIKIEENARKWFLPVNKNSGIEHFAYDDAEHFVKKLNTYTSVEAKYLFDDGVKFTFSGLFGSSLREFYSRYIKSKGYKDGCRGFFLCIMMTFYRTMTYIKLWEYYENKANSVNSKYNELKKQIIKQYNAN